MKKHFKKLFQFKAKIMVSHATSKKVPGVYIFVGRKQTKQWEKNNRFSKKPRKIHEN